MHIPVAEGSVTLTQRWGYTGLGSNGRYEDNRFNPPRVYPVGFHTGVDLSAPRGTIIRNAEHGIVVAASWNGCRPPRYGGGCWGYGGGYVVIVKHNSVPVFTSHAHMQKVYVRPGQPVHIGQRLGQLDTMGFATGPHDHMSLWVGGLWWTNRAAYTLDPWSAFYGSLKTYRLLDPASCDVPLGVNLRSGPGRGYPIVCARRRRTRLPMFKSVEGGAVPGHESRRWRLVWCGRWAYVYQPFTTTVRSAMPDEEELVAMGAQPIMPEEEVGMDGAGWQADSDLTEYAPSPDPSPGYAGAEPEDGIIASSSSVEHLADAEDAF